jgi:RNA polymerase sigma factor (sigma-70 family)
MLSVAAKAYLIFQVFDYVHRSIEPVRFGQLKDEIEDLVAWPEFREAAINDPRFLVVGDCIDITTAAIDTSCEVEEIVIQTIDLLRVPMTDYTLIRLVRRLRPDLPMDVDPIDKALKTGLIFRTRDKHLALLKWIRKVKPLTVPDWPESSVKEAGVEILKLMCQPINAADLAAAIAEHFNVSVKDVYINIACDSSILLLPDGTACLYDNVVDELNSISSGEKLSYDLENTNVVVPIAGEFESLEMPNDLIHLVIQRCNTLKTPIGTSEIIREILGINPRDQRYIGTFRNVTAALGQSAEVLPVGHNLWQATAMVPGEVFRRVNKSGVSANISNELDDDQLKRPENIINQERNIKDHVSTIISQIELELGCINSPRLGLLLPEHPMIQVFQWEGINANIWYNAEFRTLFGLKSWFKQNDVQNGDRVSVKVQGDILTGIVYKSTEHVTDSLGNKSKKQLGPRIKSLLDLVKDYLISAGGSLDQNELMDLLNENDPDISWSEVQPLFERFPIFRYDQGKCYFVPTRSRNRINTVLNPVVIVRVINIISDLADEVRTNPSVLKLAFFVAGQERVSASEEKHLLKSAQNGNKDALEQLVLAHLRHVLRQLLHRSDIEELLPNIEDYFQEGVFGLISTIDKFDCNQSSRLQNFMGWRVKNAIDRAKILFESPIRLSDHMYWQVVESKKKTDHDISQDLIIDYAAALMDTEKPEFWLGVSYQDWDEVAADYEESGLPQWVGLEEALQCEKENRLIKRIINIIKAALPEREAEIIIRHYGLGYYQKETLKAISVDFGVTRSRIQQIESKALNKLRGGKIGLILSEELSDLAT